MTEPGTLQNLRRVIEVFLTIRRRIGLKKKCSKSPRPHFLQCRSWRALELRVKWFQTWPPWQIHCSIVVSIPGGTPLTLQTNFSWRWAADVCYTNWKISNTSSNTSIPVFFALSQRGETSWLPRVPGNFVASGWGCALQDPNQCASWMMVASQGAHEAVHLGDFSAPGVLQAWRHWSWWIGRDIHCIFYQKVTQ